MGTEAFIMSLSCCSGASWHLGDILKQLRAGNKRALMHACACIVPWEQRHLSCLCSQFSSTSWNLGDLAISNSFRLGTRGHSCMHVHVWSHGNKGIWHVFVPNFLVPLGILEI